MLTRFACMTGLLVAAIASASCDEKRSSTPAPPPAPTPVNVTVSIVAGARTLTTTAYSPNPVNITRGSTITWINNDTTTHNQVADGGAFNTGDVPPGGQTSVTFQNAGSFPYHCGRHPGMVATVNVQ